MIRLIFLISVTLLFFGGCHPKPIEGGQEIATEAELHKVKRITAEQVFGEAYLVGDTITSLAAQQLQLMVSQALEKEGVAGAMQFCKPEAYPAIDSVLQHYQATLTRSSKLPRNPASLASGIAAGLLDAYHYNAENNLPMEPNVQPLENDDLLYTKAIVINNAMCLRCHGKPGDTVAPPDWLAIQAVYPADKALGYDQGDLRGMWELRLSRAGLVKSFSAKAAARKRRKS